MILGFSTHINRKPTLFTNKIVKAIWQLFPNQMNELAHSQAFPDFYVYEEISIFEQEKLNPKLHTIREDKTNRWKAGMKIDFFINCRQKNMFRFAPVLPVVGIQKVEIKWFELFGKKLVRIFINDHSFGSVKFDDSNLIVTGEVLALAHNDGFNTITEFFDYFNEDFKGKLIHWTDMSY
ncbi:hypothetical protein [Flavobacterium sp. TAB 87]|uniref:hypothetical protein n=1 Tax=Flavobacterium sp. TAB 87 TaxID=1729581 RepID=UPI00076C8A4B|nr:hypothetical protein [Flavobacterium sp. TAB 87]KVV16118.1 hypothetical protein AP058_00283 [Flavobacterium sp. TAB 87]